VLAILFLRGEDPVPSTPFVGETVYLATFLFVAFVVGATTEALRQARTQAEARTEELEHLTVELEAQMEEVQTLSEDLQTSNDSLSAALAAAERMTSRTKALQEVTAALSQARTEGEVADVVLGTGLSVVEGARGVLVRVDGEHFEFMRRSGYAPDVDPGAPALSSDGDTPLALAVKTGVPVWLRSPEEYRARFPGAYERFGVVSATQAYVAVPLRHGAEIVGALAVGFAKPSAAGAADEAFTLLLAQAAADALFRARSYDAERAARHEAEMLAQARADVLGIVAHDLRNPLNVIGSSSSVLLELDAPSSDRQRMLEFMKRAVGQMNRLIGDLLDATSLQAGRLTLTFSDVDIRKIVQESEAMFRQPAKEKRVGLQTKWPDVECHARADEGRVLQALGNLIGNALKFTNAGGSVTLSAQCANGEIVFRVEDTGPGIPAEHQDHLFDSFWQARDGDRRGVGLGLAITKGIVSAHGGRIWVESTLGAGSAFSFALPIEAHSDRDGHAAVEVTNVMAARRPSPPNDGEHRAEMR
jgi:signal transduction histidine kinase